MRLRRFLTAAVGILFLAAASTVAQQQPIHGCNAAASCRPLGFSTLDKNAGFGGLFFGVGARFGPGFDIFIPASSQILLAAPPTTFRGEIFHLGVSLMHPAPTPTPFPPPAPTPSE
jgi:hypothetical protein